MRVSVLYFSPLKVGGPAHLLWYLLPIEHTLLSRLSSNTIQTCKHVYSCIIMHHCQLGASGNFEGAVPYCVLSSCIGVPSMLFVKSRQPVA